MVGKMLVIGGSASENLAKNVSEELNCRFTSIEREVFPDGEIYVRIPEEIEDEEVFIIQSTYHPPNRNYMELFLLLDTAKDLGASKVSAVIPYLAYSRQNERFEPGEAISLKTVANLIEASGAEEAYTIDLHSREIGDNPEEFNIPSYNLTASGTLAKYICEEYGLENPIFIGPDHGAKAWAKNAGEEVDSDWDFMVKKRLGPKEVEITPNELDVKDRDVVVIDDIISTGGTMSQSIQILNEHGAKDIFATCTHAVLSDNALEKIRDAGAKEVISTDTIDSEVSKVSVSPVISEAIK